MNRHISELIDEFKAQGALAPGTSGWWPVWGATTAHIRPGDIMAWKADDVVSPWYYIEDTFKAKAYPMRVGLIDADGERFTLGALCPIVLVRRGTRNTLAGSRY